MSQTFSIRSLINLTVYGVPASIIFVGFLAYLTSSSAGPVNIGLILIAVGLVFFALELIAKIIAVYYTVDDLLYYR